MKGSQIKIATKTTSAGPPLLGGGGAGAGNHLQAQGQRGPARAPGAEISEGKLALDQPYSASDRNFLGCRSRRLQIPWRENWPDNFNGGPGPPATLP
jgi:hypothetical protein